MEKQDEPQVDGKRGGSQGPYAAGTKYWRQVQMNFKETKKIFTYIIISYKITL